MIFFILNLNVEKLTTYHDREYPIWQGFKTVIIYELLLKRLRQNKHGYPYRECPIWQGFKTAIIYELLLIMLINVDSYRIYLHKTYQNVFQILFLPKIGLFDRFDWIVACNFDWFIY
jgi:L-rhamnose mutarotase